MKTRFAPSPTGLIHLGNFRTALFAYLFAKHNHGDFLLRIEDTDTLRSKERFSAQLQADLQHLGIIWDEGPGADKCRGPYYQSQRQEIYDKYYQQLEDQGDAYPCFCTEQQLSISRKAMQSAGIAPKYPGTCRSLSAEEVAAKRAEGIPATLRFKVPENQVFEFEDGVKGKQKFPSQEIGDFIIRRANGTASFMFCNAVDDAMMEVTHVLRGEDHLTNTPRQLMILQVLGLSQPQYLHNSLIVGPSGKPLSKREGSQNLADMAEAGYFPEAILNYLARCGHRYQNDQLMTLEELAAGFDVSTLSSSPARYDQSQLFYWQKEAVLQADDDKLWAWLPKEVKPKVPEDLHELFIKVVRELVRFPQDAELWVDLFFKEEMSLPENVKPLLALATPEFFKVAKEAFLSHGLELKAVINALKTQTNAKGKTLFMPLRAALTGMEHGPELTDVVNLIGLERIIYRLDAAMKVK